MSNPLYSLLGGQVSTNDLISQFNKFKSSFNGDPKQQVQQLLNSGRMTQEQFNRLSQVATQLQKVLK